MNPRIIRLSSPKVPKVPKVKDGESIYTALSLVDDRFVAYVHGRDLRVLDLQQRPDLQPILTLENAANHAFVGNTLVTYDKAHGFRRFVWDQNRFVETSRFVLPESAAPWPTFLVLSPSGRYLSFQLPPAAGEQHHRVVLVDAISGAILAVHPYSLSARASFSMLDAAEVLFLSAPEYMDVLLLDAASGKTLQSFNATKSWDFCHTNYELSADGTRLLAFGCIWAAPYEARLYDATPWTRSAQARPDGFPLPLLYSQNEDLQHETILIPRFFSASDSSFDVLSLVNIGDLNALSLEDARDLEEGLCSLNREILGQTRSLESQYAMLQRRVNVGSGEVESFRLVATKKVAEVHVHQLPNHQVLLIGEQVQWFDGVQVHDIASFDKPREYYETAVFSDGSAIVVRELEPG